MTKALIPMIGRVTPCRCAAIPLTGWLPLRQMGGAADRRSI